MFSKLAISSTLAFSVLAAATPNPISARQSDNCSTGPIQCCQSTATAGSAAGAAALSAIDVVVQDLNVLLGLDCSPITVVGVGSGSACSAQAVCCENNSFGSLVSIGCVPVTL